MGQQMSSAKSGSPNDSVNVHDRCSGLLLMPASVLFIFQCIARQNRNLCTILMQCNYLKMNKLCSSLIITISEYENLCFLC